MGRVSKYKKIKNCDPFAKSKGRGGGGGSSRSSEYVWGTGDNGRRKRKRSVKAQRLLARKLDGATEGRKKVREAAGAGGFDLAPSGKDDFDLADLVGSVMPEKRRRLDDGLVDPSSIASGPTSSSAKASKKKKGGGGNGAGTKNYPSSPDMAKRASIPETDADEKRVARILKLDTSTATASTGKGGGGNGGGGGSKSESAHQKNNAGSKITRTGRREGESMRAFERRVKEETRLILLDQAAGSKLASKEKTQRKKEFFKNLKSKKKRSKGGGGGGIHAGSSDDDDDRGGDDADTSFVTGERAVAAAASAAPARSAAAGAGAHASGSSSLHDQGERPPTFEFIPRGATRKIKNDDHDNKRGGGMDSKKIKAEQRAMDALRAKVQAQYAVIKERRKKAGEFHL